MQNRSHYLIHSVSLNLHLFTKYFCMLYHHLKLNYDMDTDFIKLEKTEHAAFLRNSMKKRNLGYKY